MLSINAAALAFGSLGGTTARCSACAPMIAPLGVTLAAAAASATLSIDAAALAFESLGGTGRSLLGVCAADRPVGRDARRRSCVGNALHQRCCSRRKLGRDRPLDARCLCCSVSAPPIALSEAKAAKAACCSVSSPLTALPGVTLAAAAASTPLSINAADLALGSLGGTGRSLLGVFAAQCPHR